MPPTLQSTGQQLQNWKGKEAEQVIVMYYMPLKVQENFKVSCRWCCIFYSSAVALYRKQSINSGHAPNHVLSESIL